MGRVLHLGPSWHGPSFMWAELVGAELVLVRVVLHPATCLKRWPLKLVKHLADTTRVSPSPAGPVGCCPLNFLYLTC